MADVFQTALVAFAERQVKGSPWSTRQWAMMSAEVRQKAFWSAGVENARFLQKAKDLINDYLKQNRKTLPDGQTMLKVGSRADFVRQMREFQLETGMVSSPEEFRTGADESVMDIKQRGRLNLIFDTQVANAWGFGRWKQGMTPTMLSAFPAWRFVRNPGSEEYRPRHAAHEGDVRLKTDFAYWADYQNDPEIGGFGNPWPKFGFQSNMDVEAVTRREAQRLGLIKKGERIAPEETRTFTETLKASLEGISTGIKKKLRGWLNKLKRATQRTHESPEAVARRMAKDARLTAMMDSLDKARNQGQRSEVSRIAQILLEEMGPTSFARRFNFRMRGDEIEFL